MHICIYIHIHECGSTIFDNIDIPYLIMRGSNNSRIKIFWHIVINKNLRYISINTSL